MIYILTGIAKSGKSLVSKKIVQDFNIAKISTDEIMMDLHKKNQIDNLDIYASDSTVASKLEPFINELIAKMIDSNQDVLIEGVHFNTPFSRTLLDRYQNQIRIIYLGYRNSTVKEKTEELYKYKNRIDNPWIFDHQGEKVEDIVAYMIEESKRIYQECTKLNLPYFDVTDITNQIDIIINKLFSE
jgi:adenylate kinase family enzyme